VFLSIDCFKNSVSISVVPHSVHRLVSISVIPHSFRLVLTNFIPHSVYYSVLINFIPHSSSASRSCFRSEDVSSGGNSQVLALFSSAVLI
jgi:hypothetical protein